MLKSKLCQLIDTVLSESTLAIKDKCFLETPKHKDHGDYALNMAFNLAKVFRKAPKDIATDIANTLNEDKRSNAVLTATPLNGFVNLKLSNAFLLEELHILHTEAVKYPENNERILVEYVSANPTGPLHIGHGRWAVLGSSIVSLLKHVGISVKSEFYINDAGNQIKRFTDSVDAVKAQKTIPEDGYHGHYIHQLAESTEDPLKATIASQKDTLKSVGTEFDTWFSEKSLHNSDALTNALATLKDLGYTYKKEGALWFASTKFGDDKDRVLIKADGNYAYFAADVAYHKDKLDRGFDKLINIFGADHHGYVSRITASTQALSKTSDNNPLHIIIGQLVNLLRNGEAVRMSKRSGEMITLDEVIEEIGCDATRFFLVNKSADTHIDFDIEVAKKKSSDNPVYYIQYAHARLCRILDKAAKSTAPIENIDAQWHEKERQLILHSLQVHDEIWQAATSYSPYKLAAYASDLARSFHHFYEACPILNADAATQVFRLNIIAKCQKTLALSLNLLGISAPRSM